MANVTIAPKATRILVLPCGTTGGKSIVESLAQALHFAAPLHVQDAASKIDAILFQATVVCQLMCQRADFSANRNRTSKIDLAAQRRYRHVKISR